MGNKSQTGRSLSSLGVCSQWLLVMLNVLNIICGAVIAGLGLYFLLEKDFIAAVMGYVFTTVVAGMVVTAGFLLIICGVLGIIGSVTLSSRLIIILAAVMGLITFVLIAGSILGFIFRDQINEEVRNSMRESLRDNYGDDSFRTRSWDRVQRELYCCSVNDRDWKLYRETPWFRNAPGKLRPSTTDKPLVPESCCNIDQYGQYTGLQECQYTVQGPPGTNTGVNEHLNTKGCFHAIRLRSYEYFGYAIGIGFGVAVNTVLCLVFSILLLRQVKK